ncbi:hypothetical protein HK100_004996, partial [Physocladia obscura]
VSCSAGNAAAATVTSTNQAASTSLPKSSSKQHKKHHAHLRHQQQQQQQHQEQQPTEMISKACRTLITNLLIKDDTKRLGSKAGASEVKIHAFFKDTNWALLRNQTPPIIPTRYENVQDSVANFRHINEPTATVTTRAAAEPSFDFEYDILIKDYCINGVDGIGGGSNPFEAFESITLSTWDEFLQGYDLNIHVATVIATFWYLDKTHS